MDEKQKQQIEFLQLEFIRDRRFQGKVSGIRFYRQWFDHFVPYCVKHDRADILSIDSDFLRGFFLELAKTHRPGGVHGAFRTVHAFFYWYEQEYDPPGWSNPIRKLHAPKVDEEPLDPADPNVIEAMLDSCDRSIYSVRDRALILLLQDTGVRAGELLALDVDDIDMVERSALIRTSKNGKPRYVFFDKETKKAVKAWLAIKPEGSALWVTRQSDRLDYDGLRSLIRRRAELAGVDPPPLHGFRRAFVLDCIRAGVDLLTIQRLVGHSSLAVIARYAKQTTEDLKAGHTKKTNTKK